MTDELTTFALLAGTATDAVAAPPALLRSPLRVRIAGIGTPPVAGEGLWARAYSNDGFVIVADAATIPLDDASSSGPAVKHLAGAFPLHLVLSAPGYDDLAVTVACNHDQIPISASYALAPQPFAIRGRVTTGAPPVASAGTTVTLASAVPAVPLPPPVATASDGTYAFPSVPAARSLTLTAGGQSQTVLATYPAPVLTVNFAL